MAANSRLTGRFEVLDWAVRVDNAAHHWPGIDPGAAPGRAADVAGFRHAPVTARCTDTSQAVEFDVDVQRSAPGITVAEGFNVTYSAGSATGTVFLPWRVVLCPALCPRSENHT